ncbi:hypothetical protein [Rubrobacter calidifluminis]|uniref:hypothetical protein n=1 Tax=Rubrobacter calidifluminis TaxID=1392640 RepID=UPI002361AC3E|nr:hypothetical protein [Rubrobacter calidifluminis]
MRNHRYAAAIAAVGVLLLAAYVSATMLDSGEPPLPFPPNTLWSPGGAGLLVQAGAVLFGSLILALVALTDDER